MLFQGEVLHEWQCTNTNGRVLPDFVARRGSSPKVATGEFDRLRLTGKAPGWWLNQPDRACLSTTKSK